MEAAKGKNRSDERRRELAKGVRTWTIEELHGQMAAAGVARAFVVYENGEFHLSHPRLLEPLQAFLELSHDFAQHEGIFIGREEGIPCLFFAFVHDTRRGLAQGGLRFTHYPSVADLVTDGIRLAQGMTRKNALAGLWWGGGKGIVSLPPAYQRPEQVTDPAERRRIFEAYGRFVASLGGIYYTAEDVGTKTADMDAILSQNRFVTCISRTLGGSGNPSAHTARGVFLAMQAAWLFLEKTDRLQGVKVAVQGAGNVGMPLIELLDDAGAEVWVCDVNEAALQELQRRRPRVRIVPPEEIFDLEVDVFAPCARGAQVNRRTIPRLKVRLVCGAANNILEEPADAERLRQANILFVPDYVCNRMGITNCADEWLGYLEEDVRLAAERVYPDTLRVLKHAQQLGVTTLQAADELADIAASELHPLLGHRGRRIIDHLTATGWHEGGAKRRKAPAVRPLEPAFVPALDEPRIRVEWEREGRFRGTGPAIPAIAASPVPAAARPNLASFLSPVLMDVRARALEVLTGERPRRVAGSDHGGLSLQLAVEWTLPFERQAVGRPEFVELCKDFQVKNDAAIRDQLHQLGVGFDPAAWLDPMEERVGPAIERLFYTLLDAGLIIRENHLAFRCPRCESVLVASDIRRDRLKSGPDGAVLRCGRCETVVESDSSPQLFVHVEKAVALLRQAIENGAVRFSAGPWRERVLAYLDTMEPWCISRQYWWGNEIPNRGDEVLSTWFSLAAWSLAGMGWPEEPVPDPIAEVFVDPDWLLRWVVPSQLLALVVTGRPAFRRVHVHGAVHVLERKLAAQPEAAADLPDEDRYLFRVVHRPMRRNLGNVVEPGMLVRRFGADALRLGYLLAVDDAGTSGVVTLTESHLRRARRAVHSLVSKVTGLYGMVREPLQAGAPRPEDRRIVAECAAAARAVRHAYEEHRYSQAAGLLVDAVDAFAEYANAAAKRRREGDDLGGLRAATVKAVGELKAAFSPLCPYLFEKLDRWLHERCPAAELDWPAEAEPVALGKVAQG